MALTSKQKQYLRGLAHNLKPIIFVGNNGISENVLAEFSHAIEYHELIKVKLNSADRDERTQMAQQIADQTSSEIIQCLGKTAIFFRPSEKHKIQVP